MNRPDPADPVDLANQILAYLDEHPDAADTLEGVVDWWLIRTRYLRGLSQVQATLDLLVERGQVVEMVNTDGSRVYSAVRGGGRPD